MKTAVYYHFCRFSFVMVVWLTAGVGCSGDGAPAVDAKPDSVSASSDAAVQSDVATLPAGPYAVASGFIRDSDGRALIFRGANLSQAHKKSPHIGWHQLVDYQRLRTDWGFNSIRFLISWAGVEPTEGHYDDAYLTQIIDRLKWAKQAGLWVVLDMHQDLYGEGFGGGNGAPKWTCSEDRYAAHEPISPWHLNYLSPPIMACFDDLWSKPNLLQRFAAAWRHVAQRVVAVPELKETVVGFDIINEPHWGSHNAFTFERDRLKPFYEKVINEVRQAAPHWLAFVEPGASRNGGIQTSLTAFHVPNIVYAPHSYDSQAEFGQGFDAKRRAAIIDNLKLLQEEAVRLKAALWIGEYGGVSSHSGIADYMDAQYAGIGAVAAGSALWEYGNSGGYAMVKKDGTEQTALMDAVARPYPERVAGDPISYTYDATAKKFVLTYTARATRNTESIVIIPQRTYSQSYAVQCENCTHVSKENQVAIVATQTDKLVVVTLIPK